MKKKICNIFMILSLIFILTSCHGRAYLVLFTLDEDFVFDETREYNISFWAKNDSNASQVAIYEKAISDFEELYPNIHVSLRNFSSYPDLYRDIITNIETDTTPNVAICYPDHVATYLENPSLIVNLDSLVGNENYGLGGKKIKFDSPKLEDFVTKYVEEGYLNESLTGKRYLYVLPFMRSIEVLYYNKTWVNENKDALIALGINITDDLELTWDEFWKMCSYARSQNSDSSFIPLVYQSEDNFFIELSKQYGTDYTTEDGDVLFVNDENKALMMELNTYYKEGLFIMKNNTGIYPGDKMNKGEALFGIDSSAGSTWIGPSSPLGKEGNDDFEVGVTILPQADTSNMYTMSQGPSLCLFNKSDSQEVIASWLFMQYLLTKDVQVSYAETEGYSPVTYEAISSIEYNNFLDSDSVYYVQKLASEAVIKYQNNSFITPAFNGSADVRSEVGNIVKKISVSKTKTIDIDSIFRKALLDAGY